MSDWRHHAACRDTDPELHFPIGSTGPALLQIEDAKAVCRRCPSIAACLSWALEQGMSEGVWGGMSEDERRALKRRAARAAERTRKHTPELRAQALDLFQAIRPECPSDQSAFKAVADRLGVDLAKTVRGWAVDAGLVELAPSAVANEERRRTVLLRFRDERHNYASDYATYEAVAAEYGLNRETVRNWVVAARSESRPVAVGES